MYVTKGTKVQVERLQVNEGTCLSGSQLKFGAELLSFSGTVRHIRGDHPTSPTSIAFWVEPDSDAEKYGATKCEKCGAMEVGPVPQGQIRPLGEDRG